VASAGAAWDEPRETPAYVVSTDVGAGGRAGAGLRPGVGERIAL